MKKISLETIINFYKKTPELAKAFVKSEGFKIGAIIFSCLFAFVIVFPSFLDTARLKYDLTQRSPVSRPPPARVPERQAAIAPRRTRR